MRSVLLVSLAMALAACAEPEPEPEPDLLGPVPRVEQTAGDPARGWDILVNDNYIGCGLPLDAYLAGTGTAAVNRRLTGRTGSGAEIAYDVNAFTGETGVEVVVGNCLFCHAAVIGDELIVGLGDSTRGYTENPNLAAQLARLFVSGDREIAEWGKWAKRIEAVSGYTQMSVVGANPADNLAAILLVHHDPDTLEWSDTPRIAPPTTSPPPVDVPPWWRVKKKHALYSTGAGRGQQRRHIMTASSLCVDSVAQAEAISDAFVHVRAYLDTVEAPPFPGTVDDAKVQRGEALFEAQCARCHGTYGPDGVYPNLIIGLDEIGTDPLLATGDAFFNGRFAERYNASFLGKLSPLQGARGYYAPPLDGLWATAPFLHNGSVPDLGTLLDSAKRPKFWTRSFEPEDYDVDAVGWPFTELRFGQADEADDSQRVKIYDTTLPGHGNGGHTFGDVFTASERAAVIEYLKTI